MTDSLKTKKFNFDQEKNLKLKAERGVDFTDVIYAISLDNLLLVSPHPNKVNYAHQEIMYVAINDYVYLVPFVHQDENTLFLKTVYPCRKATKLYLSGS